MAYAAAEPGGRAAANVGAHDGSGACGPRAGGTNAGVGVVMAGWAVAMDEVTDEREVAVPPKVAVALAGGEAPEAGPGEAGDATMCAWARAGSEANASSCTAATEGCAVEGGFAMAPEREEETDKPDP
jgi:hypothetical protein